MPGSAIAFNVFLSPSTAHVTKGSLQAIAATCRNHGVFVSLSAANGVELARFEVPSAVFRPISQDCLGSYLRGRTAEVTDSGTAAFGQLRDRGNILLCSFAVDVADSASFAGGLMDDGIALSAGDTVDLTGIFISWAAA
jgi:hypothetical protein